MRWLISRIRGIAYTYRSSVTKPGFSQLESGPNFFKQPNRSESRINYSQTPSPFSPLEPSWKSSTPQSLMSHWRTTEFVTKYRNRMHSLAAFLITMFWITTPVTEESTPFTSKGSRAPGRRRDSGYPAGKACGFNQPSGLIPYFEEYPYERGSISIYRKLYQSLVRLACRKMTRLTHQIKWLF